MNTTQTTRMIAIVAEPAELLPVPSGIIAELRRMFEKGRARNANYAHPDPRFESWETFIAETMKDAVFGWPRPWAGE